METQYKGSPKSKSMPPGPDEKITPLQECHYTENENIIHISDKQNVPAGGVWCPSIRDQARGSRQVDHILGLTQIDTLVEGRTQ